jgi:hypothetical protein
MINHLSLGSYEKSEQVLDQFARYCQKMVLGDFSAELKERIYSGRTFGDGCLQTCSNDSSVRLVTEISCKGHIVHTH